MTMDAQERSGPDPRARAEEHVRRLATRYFPDVQACRNARVRLGRRARFRLGSVRADGAGSTITLNPLLLDPRVPNYVLDATILHELAHLAHGFGTTAGPSIAHPHRGGVVAAELSLRGCDSIALLSEAWVKANWAQHFENAARDVASRLKGRAEAADRAWRSFLSRPEMRTDRELARLSDELAAASGCRNAPGTGWLHATLRQTRMLYVCSVPPVLRLHGLLAHRSVPDCVLAEQIAVWLARESRRREAVETLIVSVAGRGAYADAVHWRSRHWTALRRRMHPLLNAQPEAPSG